MAFLERAPAFATRNIRHQWLWGLRNRNKVARFISGRAFLRSNAQQVAYTQNMHSHLGLLILLRNMTLYESVDEFISLTQTQKFIC